MWQTRSAAYKFVAGMQPQDPVPVDAAILLESRLLFGLSRHGTSKTPDCAGNDSRAVRIRQSFACEPDIDHAMVKVK
jgi:hypothetical protein